jgi:hypothetical protein
MDYETMSDFDINKAVVEALGYTAVDKSEYFRAFTKNYPNSVWYERDNDLCRQHKDYCNNPADAWPIIVENRIQIHCWKNDLWYCAWGDDGFIVEYETEPMESPLRAAMIALLMMSNITKESVQ